MAYLVAQKAMTASELKNHLRRKKRKTEKLSCLINACCKEASTKSINIPDIAAAYIFADGGSACSPPFIPPQFPETKMPSKVLRISIGDLFVPTAHFADNQTGLTATSDQGGVPPFILVPRAEALKIKNLGATLCDSFDAMNLCQPGTFLRGKKIKIVREARKKYVCVGSMAARGHVGVNAYNPSLAHVPKFHQQVIRTFFMGCEHLVQKFLPTNLINQALVGINLIQAQTFSLPAFPGWKSKIFGAVAQGVNVVLNAHSDPDFVVSLTSVHLRETYTDRVLIYFCFPSLGMAVPLRAGDQLIFNPTIPHMISSRCEPEDDVYCTSLYLKTNVLGLNDNSLPLTKEQQDVLSQK